MASRAHTVVLVHLVEDLSAGRSLTAEVGLDGARLTIGAFLGEFHPSDLVPLALALGLPERATAAEIATAYDRRRRAPQVDRSRPYLDPQAVETRNGPALLARLATTLRHGGPIAGRVQLVEGRGARIVSMREALRELEGDKVGRAELAAQTLGLDAVRVGDVARVLAGRLEQAGILEREKRTRGPDRVLEMDRIRSGALAR